MESLHPAWALFCSALVCPDYPPIPSWPLVSVFCLLSCFPSRIGSSFVICDQRSSTTAAYFGSFSIVRQTRPRRSQAISVVPEPANRSSTISPGRLEFLSDRSTSSSGFIVGCSSLFLG